MKLTKSQAELFEWALGAYDGLDLEEFFAEDTDDVTEADLPRLNGLDASIDHCPDCVIDDLVYRVGFQAQDMAAGDHQLGYSTGNQRGARMRISSNLADKILAARTARKAKK